MDLKATSRFGSKVFTALRLMAELCRAIPVDKRPTQGIAYLCGLLHNFGYLVLGHVFPHTLK